MTKWRAVGCEPDPSTLLFALACIVFTAAAFLVYVFRATLPIVGRTAANLFP